MNYKLKTNIFRIILILNCPQIVQNFKQHHHHHHQQDCCHYHNNHNPTTAHIQNPIQTVPLPRDLSELVSQGILSTGDSPKLMAAKMINKKIEEVIITLHTGKIEEVLITLHTGKIEEVHII